jgi:hypothetical protein
MKLSCFPLNLLEQKYELLLFSQSIENMSDLFVTRKTSEIINQYFLTEHFYFYGEMFQQLICRHKHFQDNKKAFFVFM